MINLHLRGNSAIFGSYITSQVPDPQGYLVFFMRNAVPATKPSNPNQSSRYASRLKNGNDELRRRDVVARRRLDRIHGIVVPLEIRSWLILSEASAHASAYTASRQLSPRKRGSMG